MFTKQLMLPVLLAIVMGVSLMACGKAVQMQDNSTHDSPMITDTTQMFYYDSGPSIIPRTSELY